MNKLRPWALSALILLGGCSDFQSGGESNGRVGSAQPGLDDPLVIRAREGGTDMGVTQRSTADDGTVVFHAEAPLVESDENVHEDIYLRTDEELVRISVAHDGGEPDNASLYPCISADGNLIAFCSRATNLVPNDTNGDWDVFLYNRTTESLSLISVDNSGTQGERRSVLPSISADGSKVVFVSRATLSAEKATTSREDIFLRDLLAETTTLVTHDGNGSSGNSHSYDPTISGDGSKVAYASRSSNLTAGDSNGRQDIFVYDVLTGVNQRVTDGNSHSYWPSLSSNGARLSFTSYASDLAGVDTNARRDVFVWDGSSLSAITHGDGHAYRSALNGTGDAVAFASDAENLVADGNGVRDVFTASLADVAGTMTKVSVPDGPETSPAHSDLPGFSWNGAFLNFRSARGDLHPELTDTTDKIVRRTIASGSLEIASIVPVPHPLKLISRGLSGVGDLSSLNPSLSQDGRFVAFQSNATNLIAEDVNSVRDIFIRDTLNETTERVSEGDFGPANGPCSDPSISLDGRYVAFTSQATNLVANDTNGKIDVFVYDRDTDQIELVSRNGGTLGNGDCYYPVISHDGRFVAFGSSASNLVAGDTNNQEDIFVFDRLDGTTERVSVGSSGQSNNRSTEASLSSDGRYVAFHSLANNLVTGDTNGHWDAFVYDRNNGSIERVSVGVNGQADNSTYSTSLSADGRYVAFRSAGSNLVNGDSNGTWDIFVYDRDLDTVEMVSVGPNGQGASQSVAPSISADGRYVAFRYTADDLLAEDTNGQDDIFVYDRDTALLALVSVGRDGQGDNYSVAVSMSPDGSRIGFYSAASNLHPDDDNIWEDVFTTANALFTP